MLYFSEVELDNLGLLPESFYSFYKRNCTSGLTANLVKKKKKKKNTYELGYKKQIIKKIVTVLHPLPCPNLCPWENQARYDIFLSCEPEARVSRSPERACSQAKASALNLILSINYMTAVYTITSLTAVFVINLGKAFQKIP